MSMHVLSFASGFHRLRDLPSRVSGLLRHLLLPIAALATMTCASFATAVWAQGLPAQTWPAGTFLSTFDRGGRINTFHRGYLYLAAEPGTGPHVGTFLYDISDPTAPEQVQSLDAAINGHIWVKVGDMFARSYGNPDLANVQGANGISNFANPLDRGVWLQPVHDFPIRSLMPAHIHMPTYPFRFDTGGIRDVRSAPTGYPGFASTFDVAANANLGSGMNRWRIGNLLFLTPSDTQNGLAVYDIGDPLNPVLLDRMDENLRQYTNAWHVWSHYLLLMSGSDNNGPDSGNTVIIDFSDPTNLRIDQTLPFATLRGRYVQFQDNFAFAGHGPYGSKFDMLTRTEARRFNRPATPGLPPSQQFGFADFQWLPLGHLLVVSGAEVDRAQTFVFTHQDGLDTNPPYVAYHNPVAGAVNQPRTTVIGLVINEQLDGPTVSEQTIQLRPVINGVPGAALPGVVIHTSYQVINFTPVQPLAADTVYELSLVADGIHDVAGNGIAPYSFRFSTGSSIGAGGPTIQSFTHTPASPVAVGTNVQFGVAASGTGLQYRFDYGDGGPATAWSNVASAQHAYALPGSYTAQVQVRDGGGAIASATAGLTVQGATPSVGVVQSGNLLVHPTRREVWAANPDHGTVSVIDIATRTRVAEIQVGDAPVGLAVANSGHVWVANRDSDTLQRIDPATRTVLQTLALSYGAAPVALVVDPISGNGYAALSGSGRIQAFAANTGVLGASRALGPHLRAMALNPAAGALFVSQMISGNDAGLIWRVGLPALGVPTSIALALDSSTADSGSAGRGLPNYIGSLSLNGGGSQLWYSGKKDNVLRGLQRDGEALSFETSMRALAGRIDTASSQETLAARVDIDDAARLSAVRVLPGDSLVAVALEGNHEVVILDAATRAERARASVGLAPQALAFDAVDNRLYVYNLLGRSISVLDAAPLMGGTVGTLPLLAEIDTSATEPLTPDELLGKIVFYDAADERMAADGYFSCASCHLDGGNDGRTWDFTQLGEGLRNTTTLRGRGGTEQGPVHWTGNFDEIQDFEVPIRALFGGTGFLSPAQFASAGAPLGAPKAGLSIELDALAAYVATLDRHDRSPHRAADGALTADGLAGRGHFTTLQCQLCHSGSGFTDSPARLRHDVGSLTAASGSRLDRPLRALDTPTLRGLWNSGPYLHDGRAATLEEVLVTFNDGDGNGPHGDVARLSTNERQQLIAYLLQIDDSEPAPPTHRQLQLVVPAAAAPGTALALGIQSTLAGITRVEYRANDEVIGSSTQAPFGLNWTLPASAVGDIELEAHVTHNGARFNTLSPPHLLRLDDAGALFHDGFE